MDGFFSTFLYHCVPEPCTGKRYSFWFSSTNQTGIEMVRPEFLPITLILISRNRERRSFRASFRAAISTSYHNLFSLKLMTWAGTRSRKNTTQGLTILGMNRFVGLIGPCPLPSSQIPSNQSDH